jgi:YbbR domain-containing protein
VDRISTLVAHVDLTQAHQDINTVATVQALDANNLPLTGITINPDKINVRVPVTQLGGYRDVVVKVVVTGQVANGYRLTSISVSPPTVTVFSANPQLVNDLPGFVETTPIDISGAKDDLDLRTPLNLPQGVSVVGDQTVLVQIGIAAIESSITLSNMKVDVVGLDPSLAAKISPNTVVVIISGPLPLLDALTAADVHVYVDLTGKTPGTYQLEPQVDIASSELQVESILPTTLEVTITLAPAGTSTTH